MLEISESKKDVSGDDAPHTEVRGVTAYTKENGKLDHFSIKVSLAGDIITKTLYPDKNGVLWFGAFLTTDTDIDVKVLRKSYLTDSFKKYIDNDCYYLKNLVWGILDKKGKKFPSDAEVLYRKRHIEIVMEISREILNRYKDSNIEVRLKNQLDFIFDNGLEWTIDVVSLLHDAYKHKISPLSHGKMAALLFENICKDVGLDIHRDSTLFDMHTAITFHSSSGLDISDIYYEIICDADMLSKWSTEYLYIKSNSLGISVKEVYADLSSLMPSGYCPFYTDILTKRNSVLLEELSNLELNRIKENINRGDDNA